MNGEFESSNADAGSLAYLVRNLPDRAMAQLMIIDQLPKRPVICPDRCGLGYRYFKLRFTIPGAGRQSIYLGRLKDQARQLLQEIIDKRWGSQQERSNERSVRNQV